MKACQSNRKVILVGTVSKKKLQCWMTDREEEENVSVHCQLKHETERGNNVTILKSFIGAVS